MDAPNFQNHELIPVVVQNCHDGKVLMLAYMNSIVTTVVVASSFGVKVKRAAITRWLSTSISIATQTPFWQK